MKTHFFFYLFLGVSLYYGKPKATKPPAKSPVCTRPVKIEKPKPVQGKIFEIPNPDTIINPFKIRL